MITVRIKNKRNYNIQAENFKEAYNKMENVEVKLKQETASIDKKLELENFLGKLDKNTFKVKEYIKTTREERNAR